MAKKRKNRGDQIEDATEPTLDVGASRKRISDFEDVADSDDEFHINRDKVLLDEEPDAKRRRKWQEQEEFLQPSDEEVLGYSDAEEEEGAVYDNDATRTGQNLNGLKSEESENEEQDDQEEGIDWGMSKGEIYGADEIETEEQALEEEAEALRLQKKQLQSMTAADYGFDKVDWQDTNVNQGAAEKEVDNVVTEILPQLQISDDMGPVERLKLLKARYPEFEPLSKELLYLEDLRPKLLKDAQDFTTTSDYVPNAVTKLRAASAYMGSLTMYFALLTSPASEGQAITIAMSAARLRDHPVMESLVSCRELWNRAKDLPADPKSAYMELNTIESTDDAQLETSISQRRDRAPKLSRAQRHAEVARAAAEERAALRMQKTEAGLAELDALITPSILKKTSKPKHTTLRENGLKYDLEEEAPMTTKEASDKAKRKKSLRFYTSQIAQKANKRGAAGRNAGGDDDVPYRERLKDRQARLNAEAEKRGRRNMDAVDDLGGESDEDDARQARDIRDTDADADYYNLVAARTAKKKADKAALTEAQRKAALQGGQVVQEEITHPDGKRKITYAIEKNKGLTPHRKKESRNPRVKKRKKFDEKKKKLGSIKPVYKGGEGRGGYGGELTGIKKGLVKSTKL